MTPRVIVVGAGIVGLATAVALADAGARVRCLDAGEPMAERSAGGTRIFRLAHADPALVDTARRARATWTAWSRRAGRPLVGGEGTLVSGPRAEPWAAAMAAAGAPHELREEGLVDPGGGVLDLRAAGAFLAGVARPERRRVLAVEPPGAAGSTGVTGATGVTVVTDGGTERADAVVVAAGAGTPALVAPLGIAVPDALEHHARFAFQPRVPRERRVRAGRATERAVREWPCHLDGVPRESLASTYQHRTREGLWAVGGHLPDADTDYALGADEVARRSRTAVVAHVAEHLPDLDPEPREELRCVPVRGLGDGVHRARVGAVHVVWGDNLAKLAPAVGTDLAAEVVRTA